MFLSKMNYFKIIDEIRNVSDKAEKEFNNLVDVLARNAPEVQETIFWYGWSTTPGLTQICQEHFSDNNDVHEIFESAKAQGVVSHKEQCE